MNKVLVIGAGLAGAVVSRELANIGYKVLLIEKRNHIGGNMYDYVDSNGILVHKYGPHIFHTNDKSLFDYISHYSEWIPYNLKCMAKINGVFTPTPFNFNTIDAFYAPKKATELKQHLKEYFDNDTATVLEAMNCSDPIIKEYAKFLFDNDYSLYTAKQWGINPCEIDPSVLKRVPLRFSYEDAYFDDKYQFMPKNGYTRFFEILLDHINIVIETGKDALNYLAINGSSIEFDNQIITYPIVFTGPLDSLFKYKYGNLPYRSLWFKWNHSKCDSFQPAAVVAYPQEAEYTRITEYKKLPFQQVQGTTYAEEYSIPFKEGQDVEPYYPVLTDKSISLYEKYRKEAERIPNLYICGRLGDFKYYNMDQALNTALAIVSKIINK